MKRAYKTSICIDCKKERTVRSDSKAVRCRKCSSVVPYSKTHGMTGTRLHRIWNAMRHRPKHSKYHKDVKICKEWKDDFINFFKWSINNGYKDNLSIDRIDNDGNYEPSNCRWATQAVQTRNTRKIWKTNKSGYRGVSATPKSKTWRAQITVNRKAIHLGTFKTPKEASVAYNNYVIMNKLENTLN